MWAEFSEHIWMCSNHNGQGELKDLVGIRYVQNLYFLVANIKFGPHSSHTLLTFYAMIGAQDWAGLSDMAHWDRWVTVATMSFDLNLFLFIFIYPQQMGLRPMGSTCTHGERARTWRDHGSISRDQTLTIEWDTWLLTNRTASCSQTLMLFNVV